MRILNRLVKNHCIEKIETKKKGIKLCSYRAILLVENDEACMGSGKMPPVVSKCPRVGVKMPPNNIIDNIDIITADARARADVGFLEEFFKPEHQATLEQLCMNNGTDVTTLKRYAAEIVSEWAITKETHKDYNEAAKHLINTLRIKIKNGKDKQCNNKDSRAEREQGVLRILKGMEDDADQEFPF